MAHNRFEVSLLEDGVVFVEDPEIGQRVDEFDRKDFPFQTEEGLKFCQKSTFDDERILGVIESIFERSYLGLVKVYGARPDTVFSFLNNPFNESSNDCDQTNNTGKDKVKALLVQLWSRNSVMAFYKRSHLRSLKATDANIGLLKVSQGSLEQRDITVDEVTMKEGGFAIIDARLGFKIIQGVTVIVGFAIEEEIKHWRKMMLPKEPALMQMIDGMKSERIGVNVEFIAPSK